MEDNIFDALRIMGETTLSITAMPYPTSPKDVKLNSHNFTQRERRIVLRIDDLTNSNVNQQEFC